jgi:outer membrane lipoprotein-sorting protein
MRSLAETNGIFEFRIQPVAAGARRMISGILLAVRTNDFQLQASELVLADGSVVRNEFQNVRINAKHEANTFTPPITGEFKIVEPWKKLP